MPDSSTEPVRFSRSWWLARARSAAFVSLVTVLIWIYADVEFTDEMELSANIQLATAPASNLVLLSKSRIRVNFTAQGRRSSLERLAERLLAPEAVVRHEVGPTEGELSTRDILNRDPFIQEQGLTIVSAMPAMIAVRLDTRIHVPDVPVRLEYTGAFPSEVAIDPPRLGLSAASTEWQKILTDWQKVRADLQKIGIDEPEPVLRTKSVDLKGVEPDKPFSVEVVPQIAGTTVEPDRNAVTVRVKIAQLTDLQDVAVAVQVISPASWMEDGTWQQYVLRRQNPQEWRPKLQVNGARKNLDQLKPGDVQAYIVLTEDDKKPVSWLTRQVEVRLPENLHLNLLGPRPSVTFKLEKVAASGDS